MSKSFIYSNALLQSIVSERRSVVDVWWERNGCCSEGLSHHEASKTQRDALDIMLDASTDLRLQTGVYFYTKLRRVKTPKGKYFWCIAFASDDPYQGLPTS
jgi:hypothetical protein